MKLIKKGFFFKKPFFIPKIENKAYLILSFINKFITKIAVM